MEWREVDPHVDQAAEMFGVPRDEVTREQRDIAKSWAFLERYGGAPIEHFGDDVPSREEIDRDFKQVISYGGLSMKGFESNGIVFHYRPDFSGDVVVADRNGQELSVPVQALKDFIAEYIRVNQIAKIQEMDTEGLLGTFVDPGEEEDELEKEWPFE